jgi:hypothetical protein
MPPRPRARQSATLSCSSRRGSQSGRAGKSGPAGPAKQGMRIHRRPATRARLGPACRISGQGTRWHQTAYVSPEREPHCSPHSRPSCCHWPGRWAWSVTQRRRWRTSGHPSPASARMGVELRDPLQQLSAEHLAVGRVLPAAQLRDRQRLAVGAWLCLRLARCLRSVWALGSVTFRSEPAGGSCRPRLRGACACGQTGAAVSRGMDVVWSSVQSRASAAVGCHTLTVQDRPTACGGRDGAAAETAS